MSTNFPFPSFPHWAPKTTLIGMMCDRGQLAVVLGESATGIRMTGAGGIKDAASESKFDVNSCSAGSMPH